MLLLLTLLAASLAASPGTCNYAALAPAGSTARAHHDRLLLCALADGQETLQVDLESGNDGRLRQPGEALATRCTDLLSSPSGIRAIEAQPMGTSWLASAAEVSVSDHSAWLEACIEDFRALTPGTTRATVEESFLQEGGIFTSERQSYFHCDCRYLQVELRFDPATPSDTGSLNLDPADRLSGVGPVELDLIQAD